MVASAARARRRDITSYYRDRRFGIPLDDPGSGYSSLGLIPHLRPDFVQGYLVARPSSLPVESPRTV